MARYIDADKIHQFVEDNFKGDVPYEWAWTLTAIDKEPTADVVPVVRCKDCKWLYKPSLLCTHKRNRVFNTGIKRDFNCYCNYGERQEDEGK